MHKAQLILENGQAFTGSVLHYQGEIVCELVFNNCGIGYGDVLTDPAFLGQGVVFTAPLIGNYGVSDSEWDGEGVRLSLAVMQELARIPSNFQADSTLEDKLRNVPILTDVDTRALVKILRGNGSMKALLTDRAYAVPPVDRIKTTIIERSAAMASRQTSITAGEGRSVALLDLGGRACIINELVNAGCRVTRLPITATIDKIMLLNPEGLVLSNGPGDPRDCSAVTATVKALLGKLPLWGIGLGHEILALAAGADVVKLPYGHRGNSLPVKNLTTGRITASLQNHEYDIIADTLPSAASVTARNLNDGTVEEIDYGTLKAWGTAYFPSAVPEPLCKDNQYDKFIEMTGGQRNA